MERLQQRWHTLPQEEIALEVGKGFKFINAAYEHPVPNQVKCIYDVSWKLAPGERSPVRDICPEHQVEAFVRESY